MECAVQGGVGLGEVWQDNGVGQGGVGQGKVGSGLGEVWQDNGGGQGGVRQGNVGSGLGEVWQDNGVGQGGVGQGNVGCGRVKHILQEIEIICDYHLLWQQPYICLRMFFSHYIMKEINLAISLMTCYI